MYRYHVVRWIIHIVMFFLRVEHKVIGKENIPRQGPYIAAVNHMSIADAPLLLVSIPPMKIRFFAGEKWEAHPIFGPIMRWIGAIYINRGTVDRAALQEAREALENGMIFGLAPEGTRSKVRHLQKARDGAAYLASRSGAPIIPVGVINTDQVFQNAVRLRRTHLEARFGEPFMLPELGRRPRSRDLSAYTHLIMVHIAALLPERYHGYYQDSPALKALLAGEDPWPHCLEAEEVVRET